MDTDKVTIDAMRHAARALRSPTSSVHDEARALRAARDAADAALNKRPPRSTPPRPIGTRTPPAP